MSKESYAIPLFLGVACLIVLPITVTGQTTQWKLGLWWITESNVYIDRSKYDGWPPEMKDTVFFHKWVLQEVVQAQGKRVWIVGVFAHDVPKEVENDQGDIPLLRLWLDGDDLSLRKIASNYRGGTYHVTGGIQSQSTLTYTNRSPVVLDWPPLMCPFDVPALPQGWMKQALSSLDNKTCSAKDERTGKQVSQRIEVMKDKDAIKVKLELQGHEARTQTWIHECPWWSEWHCPEREAACDGLWYSKVIDWQGKFRK